VSGGVVEVRVGCGFGYDGCSSCYVLVGYLACGCGALGVIIGATQ